MNNIISVLLPIYGRTPELWNNRPEETRLAEKGSSPKSVQTLTFYCVLSICLLKRLSGGAGARPSCHWVRVGLHRG